MQPPLLEITELFAFVATEPGVGEGVAAVEFGDMMMPLIGADAERMASLRQVAQRVADQSGLPLVLMRFSLREELDTVYPSGANRA